MRKLLKAYSKQVFKKILELCQMLQLDVTPEAIHALRVELKKIRFLTRIILFYCPEVKIKKAWKAFRTFFDEAAKIRGEYVNEYRTAQSEQEMEIVEAHSSKKALKLEAKFLKSLPGHVKLIQKGMEKMSRKLNQLPTIAPVTFVNNLAAELRESLTEETAKGELHHNRHLLKGILYATEISPSISKLIHRQFDTKTILKLEDAIGDWHDLTILLHKAGKGKLTSKGKRAAKGKRKDKLELIYELIATIHQRPRPVQ